MYKNIMVPLDGSELAECVLPHVEIIARMCQSIVELVIVVEPIELPTRGGIALSEEDFEQIGEHARHDANNYLEKIVEQLNLVGVKAELKLLWGKVADCLVDYTQSGNFDLIIMATHGRSGLSRWYWGSVADRILHSASIPVLLVRVPGMKPSPDAQQAPE